MPTAPHTFAGLNTDDAPVARPASAFEAGLNLALEPGGVGPQRGNVLVPYDLPAGGASVRLGGFVDGASGTLVTLLYNSLGAHRLVRYVPKAPGQPAHEATLLEWAGLNLGPALVPWGGVLEGLLIFLDADGELRCVNLARAAAGGYSPAYLAAAPFGLHLVKPPPRRAPAAARVTLAAADDVRAGLHRVQTRAYQFALRWRYADSEQTVLSPYSAWLDVLGASTGAGTANCIAVGLPVAPPGVVEVDVLVREPVADGWLVADTLYPNVAGVLPVRYNFFGPTSGGAVTAEQAAKTFESCWPASAAALARGRVVAAATVEGYLTPEPAFTAQCLADNGLAAVFRTAVYQLHRGSAPGAFNLSTNASYAVLEGTYPNADSTYLTVAQDPLTQRWAVYSYVPRAYGDVFAPLGPYDTLLALPGQAVQDVAAFTGPATFPASTTYRVAVEFRDALGRPGGASAAKAVVIPFRNLGYDGVTAPDAGQPRRIGVRLSAPSPAAMHAEIPAWAATCHLLVAQNDRVREFRQGLAADVLAFLGVVRTVDVNSTAVETPNLAPVTTAHEKLWVDIGNWTAAGVAYTWTPGSGDMLRFLRDGSEFAITGQTGDYVEIACAGSPVGPAYPPVEIFAPATGATDTFYERGAAIDIVLVNGLRTYARTEASLTGDCFLATLNFPLVLFSDAYAPPLKKAYVADPQGRVTLESMVPAARLLPVVTTVTTKYGTGANNGDYVAQGLTYAQFVAAQGAGFTTVQADPNVRTSLALRWLDMRYSGRPAIRVPRALQRVVRGTLTRYSNPKVRGSGLNGLGEWDPLAQADEVPPEQGAITGLLVADQAQADGTVLLVTQAYGAESLSLGRGQVQTADGQVLLAVSRQVIGAGNALRGGYGCQHPATLRGHDGQGYYWCAYDAELIRYGRNGTTPLGVTHRVQQRLRAVAAAYAGATVTGAFDPGREEYWLCFGATDVMPPLTLVYSERREAWADASSAAPEAGLGLGQELVTFQRGAAWRHAPDAPLCNFYGVATAPSVRVAVANPGGQLIKTWKAVRVHARARWVPVALETPDYQFSRLLPQWLRYARGHWAAALRRDENSPGPGTSAQKLHQGRELQSEVLFVTLAGDPSLPELLTALEVDFAVVAGQQPNS